jgi:hypothetical protein
MAKRLKVGSVNKSKDKSKADYIQMTPFEVKAFKTFLSKVGPEDKVFINLESKAAQLASLDAAVESGKLDAAYAEKQKGYVSNIPDFVRFELIILDKS